MSVMAYLLAIVVFASATFAPHAVAHLVGPGSHSTDFSAWHIDPVALVLLVLSGWVYWRGSRRLPLRTGLSQRRTYERQWLFWIGWLALVSVLASPLDPLGEVLFSAHMVQHEVLMLIAAPLLVASRPSATLLRGMSVRMREKVGRLIGKLSGSLSWTLTPLAAWTIHAVGLWGWHLPQLFNASLRNDWIHALQHISFFWIALVFWYALLGPRQKAPAVNVIYLFTTAIHASLLGALLTFSPSVWYEHYTDTAPQWSFTALEDQQLGGLIMWMPAGIVFVIAGLVSLTRAMQASDVPHRGRRASEGGGE